MTIGDLIYDCDICEEVNIAEQSRKRDADEWKELHWIRHKEFIWREHYRSNAMCGFRILFDGYEENNKRWSVYPPLLVPDEDEE